MLDFPCNKRQAGLAGTKTKPMSSLAGLTIVDITFVMDQRGRRKTGEAFVQFATPEMANQALLKHKEEIGNR